MALQTPSFIAFTGVDRISIKNDLLTLSLRYPIEWGILIDDEQHNSPLFPAAAVRAGLLAGQGLRWAAHVCGTQARLIAEEPHSARIRLDGFQRVQINHSFQGSTELHIANSHDFGRRHGVRPVLQCAGSFPGDPRVDWLFDTSFGKGSRPDAWPSLPAAGSFCGFSGGLNAGNVKDVLRKIAAPAGANYWIDMESGIRTDGWLDVDKCAAVCRAVYG